MHPDSQVPPNDPLSRAPDMLIGAPPDQLFDDLRDDKLRTFQASGIRDFMPALVTIPVILVLAAILTFLAL